ncbi:MAG: hypothetical protein ACYSR4_09955 [Planctomycetota bacterium]|jgi:hypothetical protein
MRLRDTVILSVCGIAAVVLLVAGGMQLDYINSQRQKMGLTRNEPLENAPPSLAFATVAMGAFRGLVVDILWMRAERLKEEGQFFDARQLAEWITTLQPRFASVWDFHSWNMAYNISVAIPATQPEERWRWVKNGYELLRDEGIKTNPKSILLYRQLAFIFQHKIGAVSDEAHKYYKVQLAEAMEPLVEPATDEHFRALAKAPNNLEQVANDANVAPLIAALKSADKEFADDDKFVDNYLSLRQNPGRFDADAFDVIDSFRGTATLEKFDVFAKGWHLRNIWKLDPVLMQELNRKYGPVDWRDPNKDLALDWRHPDTHAIYWAVKGLRVAGKKGVEKPGESQYSLDEVNTDRIIYHSLQSLFRGGKIYIWEDPTAASSQSSSEPPRQRRKEIYLRPDLRMFEPYNRHVLTVIEKYVDPNEEKLASHQIGHRNMLKNALLSFYQSGHKRQAQKIYDQLRRQYPEDGFKVPLAVFARERFIEELQGLHIFNATELVQMLLRQGYFLYAIRDDDGAFGNESLAKEVHDFYMSEWEEQHRIDLPAFALLKYLALRDFLDDQQYPMSLRRGLLARIKIERPKLYEELMEQEEKLREQSQQGQT